VPATATLCHACTQDADCGPFGDLCLPDRDGSACAQDCSVSGTCPDGYTCQAQTDSTGKAFAQQCIPNKQSCTCDDSTRGQTRPCTQTNTYGACMGTETCDPDKGFVGCTAAAASQEICDGIDNNCNGLVDEDPTQTAQPLTESCGNGHAPCVGVETCTNGSFSGCTAAQPQPEVCNGIDDNCNGQVDEGLLGSPDSCGACGNVCAPGAAYDASTQRQCVAGANGYSCGPFACIDPYYDVDGDPANGCETSDDLPMHSTSDTALGADGGGPACEIWDSQNNYCNFSTPLLPSDAAPHVSAPVSRNGPTPPVNNEEWFRIYADDEAFSTLDIRSRLDVSNEPAANLYEFCQSTAHDSTNLGASCGAAPTAGAMQWCTDPSQVGSVGACCCAYGGQVVSIPFDIDIGGAGDDSGYYYVRVRWLSGTTASASTYQVRICDDSGDKNCY
jgi:hypothetical protein